jgi:hypothetical protein
MEVKREKRKKREVIRALSTPGAQRTVNSNGAVHDVACR